MRRNPLSLFMLGGIALTVWQGVDTNTNGQTFGQENVRTVTPQTLIKPTSGTSQSATPRAVISRNNILHVRNTGGYSIRDASAQPTHDYDYDLLSGKVVSAGRQERHGVVGVPVYATSRPPGDFSLAPGSPGFDAGVPIPNFNDGFQGQAPDMGACEAGAAPLEFGVDACLDDASRRRQRKGTPQ